MRRTCAALALLVLVAFAAAAEDVPANVPEALRPLAPLAGKSWVATFPGGKMTDEQKFDWLYGGRFLRGEHWVRDENGTKVYEGETIYAWDPLTNSVVWWYWNATGGYITGTMTAKDGELLFEGENHAPKTQTPKVRSVTRSIKADSWESVQYFDRDGAWKEQFAVTYKLVRR